MANPDVVIIGGGIIGCSCAYYLAKESLKVALIERNSICSEASKSSQGHLFLWELPPINIELAKESKKLYEQLYGELDIDFELRNTGSISIAKKPQDMGTLRQTLDELRRAGVECQLLDAKDFIKAEPNVARDISGGAFFPEDGQLNPLLTTIALAQAAKKLGADIRTFTEVTAIELSADKSSVLAVETTKGKIATKCIVNAAGSWSGQIGEMVGLNIPVVPRRGNLIVTEQVPDNFINCQIIIASGYLDSLKGQSEAAVAANVQQTREGNLLLGSSREFAGFDKNVNPQVISRIAKRCTGFFPALAGISAIRSWAGLRPYSPDLLPIVSGSPIEGFYIASGHEGVGITMGPITGKLITQLITGQKPDLPLDQLSVERFAEK